MNRNERERFSSFVSQRIEMGETEWYLSPDLVRSSLGNFNKSPVIPEPKSAAPSVSDAQESACEESSFGNGFLTAQKSFEDLEKAVCGCMRCALGKTRTNFVFGDGNPDAGIMFIGEAPGADEDAQGVPFVGRAGQLLTRMIEAMKLRREDVYIGNILKCRPPNNRDPKPEEIEMCEPILLRQIEIIRPKVICALGRISGQTLLRTKSNLGSLRGKIHDYHGVKFIVTYHPAALLRNPHWKKPAWEDLKLVRREYDGLEL